MSTFRSVLITIIVSAAVPAGFAGSPALAETEFNPAGLPVLSDRPGEPFAVRSVTFVNADGEREVVRSEPESFERTGDDAVLATYSWGKVRCAYDPAADGRRLDVRVTVTNSSDRTIHEIHLTAAALKLGDDVRGGGSHHNIGAPTVLAIRTPDRSLAVCNPDVKRPLTVGVGKVRNGVADVNVKAGGDRMVYDELYVSRPIAPHKSDTYELSVRVGDAETNPHDLGLDVYRRFASLHPPVLEWKDRRPISRLFFGGGAPKEEIVAHFRDPENTAPPKADNEKYREAVLNKIRSGVAAAKEMDAQGILLWDIEGNSFPHPTTYIGDPRLVGVMNPDFDAVADEGFKLIADAGLLSGVCIRPTQIVYKKDADTVGHAYSPVLAANPEAPAVEQLATKIEYAKDRWGCRIFYVDTNFMWRPRGPEEKWSSGMIQAEVWRKLLERHPDVLIIPEFHYPEYLAYVAPYNEYDMGYKGVRPGEERMYPDAMFVPVIEDADPYENYDLMVSNVREGDALMTFAHSMTRNARAITHMYAEAKVLDAGPPEGLDAMDAEKLVDWLKTGDLRERFYAARALGEKGNAGAAAALRKVAADPKAEWVVRRNAVLSLGELEDAEAVGVLLTLLTISDPDLRYFAAEALGRIGAPALKPVRDRLREHGAEQFVIIALGKIGDPSSADELIDLLEEGEVGRQERTVLEALGMIGGPRAVAKLTEVVNSDRGFTRVAAAEALGDIGTPEAVEALKDARAAEQAKPNDERMGHLIWKIGRILNRIGG